MIGSDTMKNYLSLKETVTDCEKRHISLVLNVCNNNVVKAAKVLEISVSSLYRKIDKYKLKGEFK